jgi:hypothetical protein
MVLPGGAAGHRQFATSNVYARTLHDPSFEMPDLCHAGFLSFNPLSFFINCPS